MKSDFIKNVFVSISRAIEKDVPIIKGYKNIWFSGPGEGNYATATGSEYLDFESILAELFVEFYRKKHGVHGPLAYTHRSINGEGWKGKIPLSKTELLIVEKGESRQITLHEALSVIGFTNSEIGELITPPQLRYLTIEIVIERLKKLLGEIMKPWYERKVIVSKSEYEEIANKLVRSGWAEVERLGHGRTTGESVRVSHRETGRMVCGWDDVDREGTETIYWIVSE